MIERLLLSRFNKYNITMKIDTIFFDLDSTLYPESSGLWQAIRCRIDSYMLDEMGFSEQEIPTLRQKYLSEHGTTLKGLQIHHLIDPSHYLNYVHDLPLHDFLTSDPNLREILLSIPKCRWIFTNADADHANRVTSTLGISDCFDGVIDIHSLVPYCKPEKAAFSRALELAGNLTSKRCAFLDDSPINITVAKELGFFTILVGKNGNYKGTDRCVETIHQLPDVVPEFWS
jgi:pyrimidine 5'-nucleotidase